MASKSKKVASKQDDTPITFEDQQKINRFARRNATLADVAEEISQRKKELQNIDDASTDLMMLDDDQELVPYQLGEIFFRVPQDEAQQMLDQAKEHAQGALDKLEVQASELRSEMATLKRDLYGKFGDNINLESDD